MKQIDQFMKAIGDATPARGDLLQLRYGIVTDTTGGITVTIAGETVEDVACLDHVTVHIDDQVAMLASGGDLVIFGVVVTGL